MNEYFENLNETIKEYFKVLSDEIPDFLYDYINTKPMQRIGKIGCGCGTDYTKIFNNKFFYSNLDHSIGVALIIWNFTKNKKQTIAGLFHDISTPVFKHCIDFMNGDHETQESTECFKLFRNSSKISESDFPVFDKYCVSITAKRRYIVPLVEDADSYKRINFVSNLAKEKIDNYLKFKTKKYAYLDFDF